MFVNKHEDTVLNLPDADNNTFHIGKNEREWVWGRGRCWTIFGVCDMMVDKDEKLAPFLAILLIQLKQQKEGFVVGIPEPGSKEEKVWGSDNYDNN